MLIPVSFKQFAPNAPPWKLSDLDNNFASILSALNNPNTFSNGLQDAGTANNYVLTPAVGTNGALTFGLILNFKAINANTGPSTLNYAGNGAKNILNADGTPVASGQIPASSMNLVVYDGTSFILLGSFRPWVIARRKTADQFVTSSTVLVNDLHLAFAIGANEEWVVSGTVFAESADLNTSGAKFAYTGPAGCTFNATMAVASNIASNTLSQNFTGFGTTFVFPTTQFPGGSSTAQFTAGMWALNGATPGTITLQFAQNTSSGNSLTLSKGSFWQGTRIA
jgi:hypothetical protein